MIAIDRGSDDGLDEGMVVLSRGGSLVGTVARAYEDFAWVRLITDPDSAVNAQVSACHRPPQAITGRVDVIIGATPTPQPAGASPGATASANSAPDASPDSGCRQASDQRPLARCRQRAT